MHQSSASDNLERYSSEVFTCLQLITERLFKLEMQSRSVVANIPLLKQNDENVDEMLQQPEGVITDSMASKVSKMIEVAVEREVQDLKQRITVLEAQVAGHKDGVTTGFDPKEDCLPRDHGLEENPHTMTGRELIMEASTHCNHPLEESIWEAALLTRLRAVGNVGSTFIGIGVISNIVLQLAFLSVVYYSFLGSTLPSPDSIWEWRLLQGHHVDNMIHARRISLARAICDSDPTLILSANQQAMHDALKAYKASENIGIPIGGLLCTMTLCFGVMYIGEEFKDIGAFANAVLTLPRSKATQLVILGEEIVLETCSFGRVIFMMILIVIRLAIAITLLIFGSIWLARTVSLQELVLNACALAMVLDLDELIFATVIPSITATLVQAITPLKISLGFRCKSVSLDGAIFISQSLKLLGAFIYIVCITVLFLKPNMDKMDEIVAVMCGGLKDFVFDRSALDMISITGSNDPSQIEGNTFARQALHDVIVTKSGSLATARKDKVLYLASFNDFLTMQKSDIGSLVDILTSQLLGVSCEDYDFKGPDALAVFAANIEKLFGHTANSCEDLMAECPGDSRLLRAICPVTCGCNEPFSGLYKRGDNQGCPAECSASATYTSQLAVVPCRDSSQSNLTQMPGWTAFLTQWLDTWSVSQPSKADDMQQAFSALLNYGCIALGFLPVRIRSMICQPTSEFGSLNVYCPVSCGCMNLSFIDCPTQCFSSFT